MANLNLTLSSGIYVDPRLNAAGTYSYDTYYSQMAFNLGVELPPFWSGKEGKTEGRLLLEGFYARTDGNPNNFDSHRQVYGGAVGFRQRANMDFIPGTRIDLFADLRLGLGFASNALNFGKGTPLEHFSSINPVAHLMGGVDWSIPKTQNLLSLAFAAGAAFEFANSELPGKKNNYHVVSPAFLLGIIVHLDPRPEIVRTVSPPPASNVEFRNETTPVKNPVTVLPPESPQPSPPPKKKLECPPEQIVKIEDGSEVCDTNLPLNGSDERDPKSPQ